ncbi:family 43 glycosylhydrolase [Blastococcus haudaquaticus]|uniref:Arabinan endo-1,5-alpha-L-arabinosidase n=1 Tax=Blastococcus haudaquaticus TaxID=1938745 RepID=A0A286H6U9_9ACTN|nr:family 43 glycosylhydrolase [Blastococcus haudaquaticus]SOE03004.1 arabinan endo-1,5-alpha-L-arabinosidase [Blastococcus haudaquaticus]
MARRSARSSLTRSALLIAFVVTVGLVVPTTTAAAAPGRGGANPGSYENPLLPVVPEGGLVESCADPTVISAPDPATGQITWHMYCTTDPLNDADVDADGDPIFHRIPMMTSTDLVDWTYVGDAFPQGTAGLPDWADDDAALWAPEVVHSTTYDQYYLFFGVTDTTAAISGVEGCDSDNAIGVAVSDGPTGPWTFSDQPVVDPRPGAGGGCDFLWTYDPDVLGDSVGNSSTLYYGSYYGGVHGTTLALTEDGAEATGAPVMVAIDNKYEGANVVEKDGYYYIFLSATNCCNGALTGYAVFVGRSESPLGPFVDQYGNSLTDAQAGGTPFLYGNGNQWTGTGHNTVFQDANGDWWTIYHAVDQNDPFFAFEPGFTKRPALLDAIDWVDGWPTVNGGSGPSTGTMPAPAAQEGQVSRHRTRLADTQAPHKLLAEHSDEFDGETLDGGWTWDRGENAPATEPDHTLDNGVLTVDVQHGDTNVTDDAWVLTRDAPRGDYVAETRVRTDIPDEGCCFNFSQAGIGIYGDMDHYVKLTNTSIFNTRQTEWAKEIGAKQAGEGWSRYGNSVIGPPSEEWTYLRVVVERLSGAARAAAGGDTHGYTGYTSQDGVNWARGQTWTHTLGDDQQIALFSQGTTDQNQQFTAEFDYVRVSTLKVRPTRR